MDYTHDLLRQLTDAELADPDNAGVLYEICAHEDMAALRYLVEERHLSVEGKSYLVCSALEGAAVAGSIEMIEYLVQHGADVNQTSAGGYHGPLINAARSDKPLTVLRLLDLGAAPDISPDTTEELLFNMLPYPDVLKRVLEAGADPDFESLEYDRPLDACCFGGYENGKWDESGVRIDTSMTESMQVLLEGGSLALPDAGLLLPYETAGYPHRPPVPRGAGQSPPRVHPDHRDVSRDAPTRRLAFQDLARLDSTLRVAGGGFILVCPVAGWLRIAAMRRGARLGGKRGLPAQQGADMGNGCGLFLLRF